MRIMALDYGDRHIGVAVSDESASICGEAFTMEEESANRAAKRIAVEVSDRGIGLIVLGYPRNMNGSIGPRAEKTEQFAEKLRKATGLEVRLWDERRTTVDAHRILSENGRHGKQRKQKIDAVAASLILEGFLGSIDRV